MPLPTTGPIALQGLPSNGALGSKPRRAVIINLSDETLDALFSALTVNPNEPPLQVEFGDTPGIHIGGVFRQVQIVKEQYSHELFSRQEKPHAPLKPYALVEGKLTIQRELLPEVANKVKSSREELVRLSNSRVIQRLDAPVPTKRDTSTKPKKKKAISRVIVKPGSRNEATKKTLSTNLSSPLPTNASSSSSDTSSLRRRLIHFLGHTPSTSVRVLQEMGGTESHVYSRSLISDLLSSVAIEDLPPKKSDTNPSPRLWRLRNESWLDVRPDEYPDLDDDKRRKLALGARTAFTTLKIPESDPRWDPIRYKPSSIQNGSAATSGSAANSAKKTSTPTNASRTNAQQSKDMTPTPRRSLPGSRRIPEVAKDASPLNSPSVTPSSTLKSVSSQRNLGSVSKAPPANNMSTVNVPIPMTPPESVRRTIPSTGTSRDNKLIDGNSTGTSGPTTLKRSRFVDERDDTEHIKMDRKRKKPLHSSSKDLTSETRTSHKVISINEEAESVDTRNVAHTSSLSRGQDKSGTHSRRPINRHRQEHRSEHPRIELASRDERPGKHKTNGLSVKRRRSPSNIYTSSSEDDRTMASTSGGKSSDHPHLAPRSAQVSRTSSAYIRPKIPLGGTLPSDHAGLRQKYKALYPIYLNLFQKRMEQRTAIEQLLDDGTHTEEGEVEEDREADPSVELMDASDLEKLSVDCVRLEKELKRINETLSRSPSGSRLRASAE